MKTLETDNLNEERKNMSRPKQFPTEIFVTHEGEGDDAWRQVYDTAEESAELGEQKRVGRYLLAEVLQVETEVKARSKNGHCHPNFKP